MVLLLWINGYRHDFTTDEGFDPLVGVAAGTIELPSTAAEISRHLALVVLQPPKGGVDNVHTFRLVLCQKAFGQARIPCVLALFALS